MTNVFGPGPLPQGSVPGDQCELYDLNVDPYEMNNLFDQPEHRDRIREVAAMIRAWQLRTNDRMTLPAV